jgi:hypothetical protein
MKIALMIAASVLVSGCATQRKPSPAVTIRDADRVLARTVEVHKFEGRLNELGAIITLDPTSGERSATVALAGKPGYFPPRTLQIVYVIGEAGRIELRSAELISLGSLFAKKE